MKRIHIIIILALFSSVVVSAQTSLREGRIISAQSSNSKAKSHVRVNISHTTSNTKGVKNGNKVISNDTIYCSQTKKQYGWFAPMDTITKDIAWHRGYSFRFTNKNVAGHWLRMECIDSYGHYVKGSLSPYILKLGTAVESDKNANSDWVEKLKTACIWEFIADYTGETIVQERAYDEDMNIIFTFSRVPIGNGQYNCSYKDCYGLPAEMRNDKDYTYGTLVRITEDQWGNDSVMQYIDAKGLPKLNSDSVAMEVFICDKYGHFLKQQSRNIDGSLAIDNWGNCGIEYEWNNTHDIVSATYMDDNWKPMRMPAKRGNNGREGIITTNYRYDKYRRQVEEYYTDTLGGLDENLLGTHRITYEFDDKGNVIEQCGYNKKGHLSPLDNADDAIYRVDFDDKGNTVNIFFIDKNNKPNSKEGYLSRVHKEYDEDGNEVLEEKYSAETGVERLSYQKRKTKNYIYTKWDDDSYRIDSLDSKGRTTFVGFFDATGNFEMSGERAYERYSYVDEDKQCTQIEIDYDTLGNKVDVDGICKTITVADSTKWTKTKWRYDKNDVLVETFIHQYDKGFNRLLSQEDANAFGVKSRSGGFSWVRYYTGKILYNQKGKFASLYGRDEFDEPDYITSNSVTYYYTKGSSKSESKRYDEDNKEIEDVDEVRDRLPKVMTIEIVDSSAYRLGLRDNDVILCYGDYAVDIDALDSVLVTYEQFRCEWSLRSVLDARKNKRMIVFRIEDAQNNKFGLVEINNLIGTPSELGFLPHVRYLTKKQLARIQHAVKDNMQGEEPLISIADLSKKYKKGDHSVIMGFRELFRTVRNSLYGKNVTDPSILLGACVKERNLFWNATEGENMDAFEEMVNSRNKKAIKYPSMHFFVTRDMNNIIHMNLEEQYAYVNWFDTQISDEDYAQLLELNKLVCAKLDSIKRVPSAIKSKALLAQWHTEEKGNSGGYSPEGHLYFDKNGTCQGILTEYGKISFSKGEAVYKIEKDVTGTWSHDGFLITLFPEKEDNITLSCIDLIGADDDLKERAVTYMNSICEDNKESLLGKMEYDQPQWDNDLFIRSISKNELIVENGVHDGIKFLKIKGKPQIAKKTQSNSDRVVTQDAASIDEVNPLIYGKWETEFPDVEGGKVFLSFNDDRSMELEISAPYSEEMDDSIKVIFLIDVKLGGTWTMEGDSVTIVNNPALTKIDVDIDFEGVENDMKEILKPALAKEIDSQKEEFAIQLLKKNSFEGIIPITKLTESELELNNVSFSKVLPKHQIVIGRIQGDKGFLVEKGFTGLYVILEWCDWNCTQTIDDYSKEFDKQKDFNKHIVLLPVGTDENGNDQFKDIISLDCPSTLLGLHINDSEISELYYQNQIFKRYIDWKNGANK